MRKWILLGLILASVQTTAMSQPSLKKLYSFQPDGGIAYDNRYIYSMKGTSLELRDIPTGKVVKRISGVERDLFCLDKNTLYYYKNKKINALNTENFKNTTTGMNEVVDLVCENNNIYAVRKNISVAQLSNKLQLKRIINSEARYLFEQNDIVSISGDLVIISEFLPKNLVMNKFHNFRYGGSMVFNYYSGSYELLDGFLLTGVEKYIYVLQDFIEANLSSYITISDSDSKTELSLPPVIINLSEYYPDLSHGVILLNGFHEKDMNHACVISRIQDENCYNDISNDYLFRRNQYKKYSIRSIRHLGRKNLISAYDYPLRHLYDNQYVYIDFNGKLRRIEKEDWCTRVGCEYIGGKDELNFIGGSIHEHWEYFLVQKQQKLIVYKGSKL